MVLSKERATLSELLRNLQSIQNDNELNNSESRRKLESHINRLEQQLTEKDALRQKDLERFQALELRKELDLKDLQSRLDKLVR
jgi:nucleoprotein TPR